MTRRTGQGWSTILLLGTAYGVIEAGLVDQSLFNPSFEGHDFQQVAAVPAFGLSAFYAVVFVVGHAVWSIAVPIAFVEAYIPHRRHVPWLRNRGLVATGLLYLAGCLLIWQDLWSREGFVASPGQLAGAAVVAVALITIARWPGMARWPGVRRVRQRTVQRPSAAELVVRTGRTAPPAWLVGAAAFMVASVYVAKPESWVGVWLSVAMVFSVVLVVWSLSRRPGWGRRHELALAAGALLTYAWTGFVLTWLVRPDDRVAWWGNAIFAVVAVALVAAAARRLVSADRT